MLQWGEKSDAGRWVSHTVAKSSHVECSCRYSAHNGAR